MPEDTVENGAPRPGWQQPELPRRRTPSSCPHLALAFAQLSAHRHREGHEWVCGCGAVFVVVSNAGSGKRLVPQWRSLPVGGEDRG